MQQNLTVHNQRELVGSDQLPLAKDIKILWGGEGATPLIPPPNIAFTQD
jgi:hypothetical protein